MKGLFHLVHVFVYFTCVSVSVMCVCAPHAMCVCAPHTCLVHHTHAWCTTGMPKRALDPQGTELQQAASSHVGAGTQTRVLCKSRKRSYLSGPALFIFEKESRVSQTGRTCCVARISLKLLRILLPQAPNPRIADLPPPWPTHSTVDICNCQKSLQTSRVF